VGAGPGGTCWVPSSDRMEERCVQDGLRAARVRRFSVCSGMPVGVSNAGSRISPSSSALPQVRCRVSHSTGAQAPPTKKLSSGAEPHQSQSVCKDMHARRVPHARTALRAREARRRASLPASSAGASDSEGAAPMARWAEAGAVAGGRGRTG